ncbi:hypothetical protein [Saccharopolyspora gloriosae]|uniref:hypothetical protein n=1 Tax=Saccharopolyspora gloriosae TaxID=455344 RepID=UPI001FB5D3BA|nr:hypothetical protein [Saccharopolyspora gloriosae]
MTDVFVSHRLSKLLARANETAEHAARQLYAAHMLEVTELVRDAFPDSDVLGVKVGDTVELAEVLAGKQKLWSADLPQPEAPLSYRTADDHSWGDVAAHIGEALGSALSGTSPRDRWQHDGLVFLVPLATAADVAAATRGTPGRLAAQLHDKDGNEHLLWLAEPVTAPTMTVGGLHVTAQIDDDGRVLIDVDEEPTKPVPRESAGQIELAVRVHGATVPLPARHATAASRYIRCTRLRSDASQ